VKDHSESCKTVSLKSDEIHMHLTSIHQIQWELAAAEANVAGSRFSTKLTQSRDQKANTLTAAITSQVAIKTMRVWCNSLLFRQMTLCVEGRWRRRWQPHGNLYPDTTVYTDRSPVSNCMAGLSVCLSWQFLCSRIHLQHTINIPLIHSNMYMDTSNNKKQFH